MLGAMLAVMRRDLLLAARRKAELATAAAFFVLVASLFPLAIGADAELLRQMGPGVIWVAALLAVLLGLPRMFEHDEADGTLEQLVLAPAPLGVIVIGKVAAHWLVSGLPLLLITPLLSLQYGLSLPVGAVLMASLLLGTPVLSMLGALGAALALRTRGGSVLVALILLPLYIPVLILGAGAARAEASGLSGEASLLLLGAMLLGAGALAPWATAGALRAALD